MYHLRGIQMKMIYEKTFCDQMKMELGMADDSAGDPIYLNTQVSP